MTVNLDWLVRVDVTINNGVVQAPSFNNCMIMGVFPIASIPDGTTGFATNWLGNRYFGYTNATDISTDFTKLYDAAVTATQFAQAFKYQILIKAAQEFFAQTPTPAILYVSCIDNTTTVNYVTQFGLITTAFNNFYAFYIADQVTSTQLTTSTTGIYAGIDSLTSNKNSKICFVDNADIGSSSGSFLYDSTNLGIGSLRAMLYVHSDNPQLAVPSAVVSAPKVCLAAATMSKYFTNLFTAKVGLKAVGNLTLSSTSADSVINQTTLGEVGKTGGILGVNGNCYPTFGNLGSGYVEYGLMAGATFSNLFYLDQIVGEDYLKLNVQADLATFILAKADEGGLDYDDSGIQLLVNAFKDSLTKNGVNKKIIQQFSNSNIVYSIYKNVSLADKTNRIYKDLAANLIFLTRIQRLQLSLSLSL
jgi:hypothetical protein